MRIGWEPRGWAPEGYRKYSLAFVVIVFATDMLALGILTGEQWVAAVSLALGIVTAGNVGEHREKRKEAQAQADEAESQERAGR